MPSQHKLCNLLLLACLYNHALAFVTVRNSLAPHLALSYNRPFDARFPQYASVSSNSDLIPGISTIKDQNSELLSKLDGLREKPFFRFFSVDILASCEYMPQELFECYTESCEIYPADEDEVPAPIQNADKNEFDFKLDGWTRWDMPSEDYYDIDAFPEAYTDYDGSDIWNYIHNRICFQDYGYDDDHWKSDFNKAVSGLHSMVSAQVVIGIQDKIDSGEEMASENYTDPAAEYARRLSPTGSTPLALENLHFAFMMILAAVSEMRARLSQDCDSGLIESETVPVLKDVLSSSVFDDAAISAAANRLRGHATKDVEANEKLWEARMRCRELLRIMNCVQCNKCRLHGKIAILGLIAAMQIIVGTPGGGGDPQQIKRVELAALVTTLHKFSKAISFCQSMQ